MHGDHPGRPASGPSGGEGGFARLARAVLRVPRAIAIGAVLVGLIAAVVGLPPEVDANLIALLPADQPHAVALRRVAEEAGGINTITLTFEGDDPAVLRSTLDALAADLTALDTVSIALHRLPSDLATQMELLAEDPADVDALTDALERGDPPDTWANGPVASALLDDDYVLLPGRGRGRIVVKPTASNVDPAFCERVVADVHDRIAATDLGSVRHVWSAGPYVFIAASASGIREDFLRTSGVTLALVLGVLIAGFRSLRAPLVVFPPVLLAAVLELALLRVVFGALDAFTSFGTALLIGLGIDFAVHLVGRTRELQQAGLPLEDAIASAWDRTGRPCVVAGLTSAAGFVALAGSEFRGLAHLGFALCTGLLLALVCMGVLLPVLITWVDPNGPVLAGSRGPGVQIPRSWARAAFVGLLLASVGVAAVGLPRLGFEVDITRLNRDRMVFSDMDAETRELVRDGYPPIVVTLPDEATVRAEHARLEALRRAGGLPHVRRVLSVASLLPDDQESRLPQLTRLAEAARGNPALPVLQGWVPRVWTADTLDPALLALVGGRTRLLLLPTGDLFDLRESSALIDEIDGAIAGAGSEQLAQGAVFRMMQRETPRFVGLAFALVALLTALDLRRPALVVATLTSLGLGMVWAGSLLGLMGIQLTLMNLIGIPILLGIGVDGVVHLAHRLAEGSDAGTALRAVGTAAVLSTLTTMASFASLLTAGSGGLRSFGQLVVVGLAAVTGVSVTALYLGWAGFGPAGSGTSRPTDPARPPGG